SLKGKSRLLLPWDWWLDCLVMGLANQVVAVSASVKEFLVSTNCPESKIAVIPTGVALSDFRGESERSVARGVLPNEGENTIAIGYVGRLSPEKNLIGLLSAYGSLTKKLEQPNLLLIIVGSGPQDVELSRISDELGVKERVTFLG